MRITSRKIRSARIIIAPEREIDANNSRHLIKSDIPEATESFGFVSVTPPTKSVLAEIFLYETHHESDKVQVQRLIRIFFSFPYRN